MKEWTDKELAALTVADAVRVFKEIKNELEVAKETKTNIQKVYDFFRFNVLPEKMDDEGVAKIDVGDAKIRLQDEYYTSIPADHKAEAYQWLRENELESVITETVNGSTLKATIKAMYKNGQHVPEDLIKVTIMQGARFY